MLGMPARGILEIGRQERELGFSFSEEMASRGATGTSLVDDDWFIEISNARVVAFRRDYLKKITAHENSESGDRCTVTTRGGRKIKVYAAGSTLEDLRTWFKQGAKARSTVTVQRTRSRRPSERAACHRFKYGKGRSSVGAPCHTRPAGQREACRSTCPLARKATPSSSSNARCTSGLPKANPSARRPSANTMR